MKKTILISFALIATGLVVWYACEKEPPEPPVGQTNKITFKEVSVNPSYRQAEISYSIENFNQNNVNSVGLCYNTSGEPTTDDNTVSLATSSSGTKTIDGLSPDTEYHFRLYTEIGDVIVYSDDENFNTKSLGKPTVTTAEVTNIDSTSATTGGNITDNGGLSITARGVCWSTSQNPTVSDNHTNNGTGTGSFTSELTGLTEGTTYYVRAYATNSAGTAYGAEKNFTNPQFSGTFTDSRDGQTYEWVTIGDQVWMAENLNYDQSSYGNDWSYDNDESNCDTYGRLYDWKAVMQGETSSDENPSGVQGVCPDGWHVPSDEEWKELEMEFGMGWAEANSRDYNRGTNEGSKLAGNASLWADGKLVNNSEFATSGFTALPGGGRSGSSENFYGIGNHGTWFSSTGYGEDSGWGRTLNYDSTGIDRQAKVGDFGFSVCCVKD